MKLGLKYYYLELLRGFDDEEELGGDLGAVEGERAGRAGWERHRGGFDEVGKVSKISRSGLQREGCG